MKNDSSQNCIVGLCIISLNSCYNKTIKTYMYMYLLHSLSDIYQTEDYALVSSQLTTTCQFQVGVCFSMVTSSLTVSLRSRSMALTARGYAGRGPPLGAPSDCGRMESFPLLSAMFVSVVLSQLIHSKLFLT